ncbi:alpha/beta hydrolase family protein [Luteimonas sp. SDU82]|uniref:alpha/beta hydrolase family protein n=1 Tax=Luteimonas sp. SDU82 TaxID=3422592 RepID=UPI003EB7CCFE
MKASAPVYVAALCIAWLGGACSRSEPPPIDEAFACQAGAWALEDGTLMAITPVTGGLRYRLLDGRSGNLEVEGKTPGDTLTAREGWREQGPEMASARFEPCPAGRATFSLTDGPEGAAKRLPLQVTDTRFVSDGLQLRGRLLLPAGADAQVPLTVLVHGSERYSGVDSYPLQYLLPARGVAVFVYDKRGTGGSEGEYTQDFHALAGDAIAALAEARRMAPGLGRAGFVGSSQGGWIAPLAASRSDADYAVALFGLAENALAEDREQVMDELRAKGHGDDVLAQAREVTDATATLMASRFTRGFEQLQAVQDKYGDAPWFQEIQGEYSGQILRFPSWAPQWAARAVASRRDLGTSWDYEPLPVLQSLAVPQLWVVAAEDREAPNVETLRRIRALQAKGRPIDLAVFPDTDHGMLEYEERDGERVMLRHADGYFRLVADWIAGGELDAPYGRATLERASNVQADGGAVPADATGRERPAGE